jgi:hypothetical protein
MTPQLRELAAPPTEQPINYSPTFVIPAAPDRRTQEQIFGAALKGGQRAFQRGTAR